MLNTGTAKLCRCRFFWLVNEAVPPELFCCHRPLLSSSRNTSRFGSRVVPLWAFVVCALQIWKRPVWQSQVCRFSHRVFINVMFSDLFLFRCIFTVCLLLLMLSFLIIVSIYHDCMWQSFGLICTKNKNVSICLLLLKVSIKMNFFWGVVLFNTISVRGQHQVHMHF